MLVIKSIYSVRTSILSSWALSLSLMLILTYKAGLCITLSYCQSLFDNMLNVTFFGYFQKNKMKWNKPMA